jgi:hypothetical protein
MVHGPCDVGIAKPQSYPNWAPLNIKTKEFSNTYIYSQISLGEMIIAFDASNVKW